LTVLNGYGSGEYAAGDTVHLFARAFSDDEFFERWSGDTLGLQETENWHTTLVMPAKAVALSAVFKPVVYTLSFDTIRAVNLVKPVYYAFPPGYKGVIYYLHGSGGSANVVVNGLETSHFARKALHSGYAFVVTEAEESTLDEDTDNDGKIRWKTFPYNLTNIDMANVKAITDSLIQRGFMSAETPRYAVGISNGGFYAHSLAATLGFQGVVSYIGQGNGGLFNNTTVPTLWIMNENDSNDGVGPAGNQAAYDNYVKLQGRGVCTDYVLHRAYPLYAQRYERDNFPAAISASIYNELQTNKLLDAQNRPLQPALEIFNLAVANPAAFPVLNSLGNLQLSAFRRQTDITYAEHIYVDDWNGSALRFLDKLCAPASPTQHLLREVSLKVFPNPVSGAAVTLSTDLWPDLQGAQVQLINAQGMVLDTRTMDTPVLMFSMSNLPAGVYAIKVQKGPKTTIKFVLRV
jgi:hypothetical protein